MFKVILIVSIVVFFISCNENKPKVAKNIVKKSILIKKVKKIDKNKIESFNIKKNCSICHKLPKFSEKEKDYLLQKLDLHRKLRRITLTDEEFRKLKERILKQARKERNIKK